MGAHHKKKNRGKNRPPLCQSTKQHSSVVVTTDLRLHKERTTSASSFEDGTKCKGKKSTTMPPETAKCQSSGV